MTGSSTVNINMFVQKSSASNSNSSQDQSFVNHLDSASCKESENEKGCELTRNSNGITGEMFEDCCDFVCIDEKDVNFFEHQVSGHGTNEKGLLKHKLGYVLKPVQPPPMGTREESFYRTTSSNKLPKEDWFSTLCTFTPNFYGVGCINRTNSNGNEEASTNLQKFLLLEDVLKGFKKPCVLDMKIGSQTWSPDASEAKIKQEMSKYKGTKSPFGMSLTGMQYFDICKNSHCKKPKDFGKSLDKATLTQSLLEFFNAENSPLHRILIKNVIERLRKVDEAFSVQTQFKIYGSSILIVYDADCFSKDNCGIQENSEYSENSSTENDNTPIRVRLIDFAHVHQSEDETLDENYLFGLRNFIKFCCDIAEPAKN